MEVKVGAALSVHRAASVAVLPAVGVAGGITTTPATPVMRSPVATITTAAIASVRQGQSRTLLMLVRHVAVIAGSGHHIDSKRNIAARGRYTDAAARTRPGSDAPCPPLAAREG